LTYGRGKGRIWEARLSKTILSCGLIDARDLKSLLEEADITESKSFLRSFIKRIEINKGDAVIDYSLPVPPYRSEKQSVEVLPIDNFGEPSLLVFDRF